MNSENSSPGTAGIIFRKLLMCDIDALAEYLNELSPESRRRFGPHSFDRKEMELFYQRNQEVTGFVAVLRTSGEIIAYAVLKAGFLEHDRPRLESYGLQLSAQTDCTFAPSVADRFQGKGIGQMMFQELLPILRKENRKRIILWGGVQADNTHAVNYYTRLGFINLGGFEYCGWNYDMIFLLD